jgi:hypothetical protein
MCDDKLRILAAVKKVRGDQLTTVFPRQGHHALDSKIAAGISSCIYHHPGIRDGVGHDLLALLEPEKNWRGG